MAPKDEKIKETRSLIADTEQRVVRQRRRVEKLLIERHPADEAQAQLLILEQSLLAMTRYLATLLGELELRDKGSKKHARKPSSKANEDR